MYKIRKLYKKIEKNDIFHKYEMYGISIYENEEYKYYVGSKLKLNNTEEIIMEKGKYAVFEVGTKNQNDIVKVYDFVYSIWIKSTDYEILNKPEIELYDKDNCYIYFKIKDKQN